MGRKLACEMMEFIELPPELVAHGGKIVYVETSFVFTPHIKVKADSQLRIFLAQSNGFGNRPARNHQAGAG